MEVVRAVPVYRLGVVATDPLRVLGLKSIFSEDPPIEVVHLSAPGALNDRTLALILIDAASTIHLLELIATFRQLRPTLKLIVLGGETDLEHIQRIIGAGVKGYLSLEAQEPEIRTAVETVRAGSLWAPMVVLSRLLDDHPSRPTPAVHPEFTVREIEVLRLLRGGLPNSEIANSLGIDKGTVKAHIGRLMRKVGVTNRIALTLHPFTQP